MYTKFNQILKGHPVTSETLVTSGGQSI